MSELKKKLEEIIQPFCKDFKCNLVPSEVEAIQAAVLESVRPPSAEEGSEKGVTPERLIMWKRELGEKMSPAERAVFNQDMDAAIAALTASPEGEAVGEPVVETLYTMRCGWCGAYEGTVDPNEPCASDGEGYIGPHQFGVAFAYPDPVYLRPSSETVKGETWKARVNAWMKKWFPEIEAGDRLTEALRDLRTFLLLESIAPPPESGKNEE